MHHRRLQVPEAGAGVALGEEGHHLQLAVPQQRGQLQRVRRVLLARRIVPLHLADLRQHPVRLHLDAGVGHVGGDVERLRGVGARERRRLPPPLVAAVLRALQQHRRALRAAAPLRQNPPPGPLVRAVLLVQHPHLGPDWRNVWLMVRLPGGGGGGAPRRLIGGEEFCAHHPHPKSEQGEHPQRRVRRGARVWAGGGRRRSGCDGSGGYSGGGNSWWEASAGGGWLTASKRAGGCCERWLHLGGARGNDDFCVDV
mmetsp:Transcript_31553/g.68963  ORF Transcript_31553/g.68963 Transcript_31553/m.68963 type:complete len:255 (+) Transcript_31553:1821-2585(+)